MKIRAFQKLLLIAAIAPLLAMNLSAQDSSATAAVGAPATNSSAPVRLSYGVPQVLQLSQAKVGDDTITAYIQNSGTIYALDANQIVYLRQQGVSDRVITAMLNQRKNISETAAQAAAQNQNNSATQTSTAVSQPTYETVPSSSVYVIPDTQTYNYDSYYYQPYYYPYGYYGWSYPVVSFGFYGGYRGGYYYHGGGGWHSSGGWHGGGSFHGGGGGGWHHH